jgi:hypothetical protein
VSCRRCPPVTGGSRDPFITAAPGRFLQVGDTNWPGSVSTHRWLD